MTRINTVGCGSPSQISHSNHKPGLFFAGRSWSECCVTASADCLRQRYRPAKRTSGFFFGKSTVTELAREAIYGQESQISDWVQVDRSKVRRNCTERLRGICQSQTEMSDPVRGARIWQGRSTTHNRASRQTCCSGDPVKATATEYGIFRSGMSLNPFTVGLGEYCRMMLRLSIRVLTSGVK